MNKFKTHPAWSCSEKKKFNYDSSMTITITRLRERKGDHKKFIKKIKTEIADSMPNSKVTNGTLGYYNSTPALRVYFDSTDASTVDKIVDIVDENHYDLEVIEIKTPRDENHAQVIQDAEVTQVVRGKLFYGKYRYSVKMKMKRGTIPGTWFERQQTFMSHFSDCRIYSSWHDSVVFHTNSLEELMLFRMTYDVEKVEINEILLLDEIPMEEKA